MLTEPAIRPRLSIATALGLLVALFGPFLAFVAARAVFGAAYSPSRVVCGMVFHWVNFAVLIAIVVSFERRPLASIGLLPLRWWTIPAGMLGGVAIALFSGTLVSALRLSAETPSATYFMSLPFWMRLALVITAGVFEETLYRGYAIERLTTLWGSKWAACLATVALFTLAHLPGADWSALLPIGIVALLVTLLYLWRRDLVLNIIAHATIDAMGLLLNPVLAAHGH